jgi:N-acetylneuraminate synthase
VNNNCVPMSNNTIQIGPRIIGRGQPALLIAEVSQSHDGSLGMAHAFIDAAAEAGADAIKFQTHIAAAESTLDEPFRVKFSRQDDTRYAYWQRMEFTPSQWAGLAQHAKERGLVFLSSPFSIAAIELLKSLEMPAWKVGSGEVLSRDLLDAMLAAGGPILLSTGMSRWDEIDRTVADLRVRQATVAVLQCTSQYPTPLEQVGLNVLDEMRQRYACPVGLSDHTGTPFPALAALARGCDLIELHVTFDRRLFGPDVSASVTFEELAFIRTARDRFAQMDQHPVDKDRLAEQLTQMRSTFGKSLAPARPLTAGTTLTRDQLTLKKPAIGIPADDLGEVIGRRLARNVTPDRLLTWEDLQT